MPGTLRSFTLCCVALAAAAGCGRAADESCRDPWISQAVHEVAGRAARGAGDLGECNLDLYGARWGSYEELRVQVALAHAVLRQAGLEFTPDGRGLRDLRCGGRALPWRRLYLGPRETAPAREWMLPLAREQVLALERRCPPGAAREVEQRDHGRGDQCRDESEPQGTETDASHRTAR